MLTIARNKGIEGFTYMGAPFDSVFIAVFIPSRNPYSTYKCTKDVSIGSLMNIGSLTYKFEHSYNRKYQGSAEMSFGT